MRAMERVKKGGYGYFSWEKKRRAAVAFALFLLPAGLFLIGYLQTGTRKNLFTLVAILGCLPACKSFVGFVMVLPRKSMERKVYERIQAHAGHLTMAYDLYVTTYEKNLQVDAAAVGGNTVVGYCSRRQEHREFIQNYLQDTLRRQGYPVTVRLLEELPPFLKKLDCMNGAPTDTREDEIRRILLAITI